MMSVYLSLDAGFCVRRRHHGEADFRPSLNVDICMMVVMKTEEREEADRRVLFEKADPRFKYLSVKMPEGSRMWLTEAIWEWHGHDAIFHAVLGVATAHNLYSLFHPMIRPAVDRSSD